MTEFPDISLLFGTQNSHIKLMREKFKVSIIARDNLQVYGEQESIEKITHVVRAVKDHILNRGTISFNEVERIVDIVSQHGKLEEQEVKKDKRNSRHNIVSPRTPGQSRYVDAIRQNDIVFGIGPAGSGKTYLAVALAVEALKNGDVRKIILVRPAVEAGEKLGFLPGDYEEKINPYLRPLYDALYDFLDFNKVQRYMEKGVIEIAPLAYMRGRTLENAFIILDEAQNTTAMQMKMFLTRLGLRSKIVVTGDVTQIDLPHDEFSGLIEAQNILKNVREIKFMYMTKEDIVRHHLVQKIVEAYEKTGNERENSNH